MEFDKSRVYTALNADELRAGDKVIVANTMQGLRYKVKANEGIDTLCGITDEGEEKRFSVKAKHETVSTEWYLAYLVERGENCTNCGASPCGYRANHDIEDNKINKCPLWFQPKTKQEAEPHYRPFKDTDELVKVWGGRMRLIDADELIDAIENYNDECDDILYEPTVCNIENLIYKAPTVGLWHYPSEGEYPKEDELVLCLQSGGIIPFIGIYNNNKWFNWDTKFIYEFEPKCWQYIVPPKEGE